MTGVRAPVRQTRRGRTVDPDGAGSEEAVIDAWWPRAAPVTVKAAVAGLFVMVLVAALNLVTVAAIAPSGEVVVEDLVIVAAFLAVVAGVVRRAPWSRYVGIGLAALFAVASISLFRPGVPGIAVGLGVVQLVVLVGVVVLLLVRPTADWYRYGP